MKWEWNLLQLMEELDNLEETLNQSIQESMGARAIKGSFKKGFEDEEEDSRLRIVLLQGYADFLLSWGLWGKCCVLNSDDDDFYDRTSHSKKAKANIKGGEPSQVVETAGSLLEKRAKVLKEIERLNELLEVERKDCDETPQLPESQDPLDAFMTTVSSKLGKMWPFYASVRSAILWANKFRLYSLICDGFGIFLS